MAALSSANVQTCSDRRIWTKHLTNARLEGAVAGNSQPEVGTNRDDRFQEFGHHDCV
jgi:hypothetical protein